MALFLYILPILAMIGLIPLIVNDYILAMVYLIFARVLLATRRQKNDLLAYLFGLFGITLAEYLFVSTGVETFSRQSLLGVMPVWLPLLWAYAFVTIKRCLRILDRASI